MTDYYTFIYCMMHDDGCMIRGKHPYVPDGYSMQHANNCDPSDWYNMGVIKYNGSTFDVVESVRVNYDDYWGGFIFIGYTDTLTDENGNMLENDLLNEWIEEFSKD